MSLESRYETLKADIEAWFQAHVFHPTVGSIAQQHLTEAKPELDKVVAKFTAPEVVAEPEPYHPAEPVLATPEATVVVPTPSAE